MCSIWSFQLIFILSTIIIALPQDHEITAGSSNPSVAESSTALWSTEELQKTADDVNRTLWKLFDAANLTETLLRNIPDTDRIGRNGLEIICRLRNSSNLPDFEAISINFTEKIPNNLSINSTGLNYPNLTELNHLLQQNHPQLPFNLTELVQNGTISPRAAIALANSTADSPLNLAQLLEIGEIRPEFADILVDLAAKFPEKFPGITGLLPSGASFADAANKFKDGLNRKVSDLLKRANDKTDVFWNGFCKCPTAKPDDLLNCLKVPEFTEVFKQRTTPKPGSTSDSGTSSSFPVTTTVASVTTHMPTTKLTTTTTSATTIVPITTQSQGVVTKPTTRKPRGRLVRRRVKKKLPAHCTKTTPKQTSTTETSTSSTSTTSASTTTKSEDTTSTSTTIEATESSSTTEGPIDSTSISTTDVMGSTDFTAEDASSTETTVESTTETGSTESTIYSTTPEDTSTTEYSTTELMSTSIEYSSSVGMIRHKRRGHWRRTTPAGRIRYENQVAYSDEGIPFWVWILVSIAIIIILSCCFLVGCCLWRRRKEKIVGEKKPSEKKISEKKLPEKTKEPKVLEKGEIPNANGELSFTGPVESSRKGKSNKKSLHADALWKMIQEKQAASASQPPTNPTSASQPPTNPTPVADA